MKSIEIKLIRHDNSEEKFYFDESANTDLNQQSLKEMIKVLRLFVRSANELHLPLYVDNDELLTSNAASAYLGKHCNYMHMNRRCKNPIPYVKKETSHCQKKIFYRKSVLDEVRKKTINKKTVELLQ